MLEKTLEGPLDSKEITPVNPKGNQPWVGKTDSEAPVLWPPDAKSPLIGKDSDAGKYWRQEERGAMKMRRLDGVTGSMDINLSNLWEIVKDRETWSAAVCEVAKNQTQLSDWKQQQRFLTVISVFPPHILMTSETWARSEVGTASWLWAHLVPGIVCDLCG